MCCFIAFKREYEKIGHSIKALATSFGVDSQTGKHFYFLRIIQFLKFRFLDKFTRTSAVVWVYDWDYLFQRM